MPHLSYYFAPAIACLFLLWSLRIPPGPGGERRKGLVSNTKSDRDSRAYWVWGMRKQGDALPGAVGIFQPIAGLGAEKPGFRVPAPAAVGGMENPVVRNEVGQLPLAEHRKVEAVVPRQIPRGIFRRKRNAPLGEHPGDFLVAAGGGAPQLRVLPATRASWRINFS